MIERNLGNIERVVRVVFAVLLSAWLFNQPTFSAVELFVAITALFLFLNGVFSRCYLWFVLDINTTPGPPGRCAPQ